MDCTQQLSNYAAEKRPAEEIGYLGILGEVHAIKMGPNKIGRDASFCDITIDKPSLSRQHAVINVLSETEFMLMDLGSVNKTKVGVKVLQPYLPHPLRNGDTVQFGDVFGIFRLFQLPDTQVEIDIPETPVCTKVVSRFAPPATVPESPDVSDKEGSFIASSQPANHTKVPFKNAIRQKETSGEKTASRKNEVSFIVPAKDTANDSVFWNASTQSPSINFNLDDSETSFDVSKRPSVDSTLVLSKDNDKRAKSSLALKRNDSSAVSPRSEAELVKKELNIEEIKDQKRDDKRLAIHEMETQNEFEISCVTPSATNKTASALNIHDQATQLDFLDSKAKTNQSGAKNILTEEENNIFEAETQLFADQDTFILEDNDKSGDGSVHNESNKVEDKANVTKDTSSVVQASESDEEILFNEFESQGFDPFPGLQESQSLIDKEAEVEIDGVRNGAVSPILQVTSPIRTTPSVPKDRVLESKKNSHQDEAKSQDSDCSTDCEDDIIVKKPTKRINVLIESDDDSTDCEESEVVINDAKILSPTGKFKKPVQNKKTNLNTRDSIKENNAVENIANALTQILPNEAQSPVKKSSVVTENLADALTQMLPVEKPTDVAVEYDLANAPTQQIIPHSNEKSPAKIIAGDKIKKDLKTVSVIESGNTHAFKKPFLSTPLKLKRSTGLANKEPSPNSCLMKGFTPLKSSPSKQSNDFSKFYDDTQDLLDDLASQKENCEANIDDPKSVDISAEVTQKLDAESQNSSVKKNGPYYDTTQDVLADMLTQKLPEDRCNGIPETGTEVESQDEDLMQLTKCVTPQGGMRDNLTNTLKMLEKLNDGNSDMVPSSQNDDEDAERFPHITKELSTHFITNEDKEQILDVSKSSSDGMETANKYVKSLSTQQVREVVGDFEASDSAKNGIVQKSVIKTPVKRQFLDSDTSDLEVTPRKQRSLFEIELPSSEEISTSVRFKTRNRTVLESSSDSDTEAEAETDPFSPIVHRRKVRSKRITEKKDSEFNDILELPKRVLTRVRKPTEKLIKNAELKDIIERKEFRCLRENGKFEGIPADIIAENIEKLRNMKKTKHAKINNPVEKYSIDEAVSKLVKDRKKESNNENKKRNLKTNDEEKLSKVRVKDSDVSKVKNTKNKEEKHLVEVKEQVTASDEKKIRNKRSTRHNTDKDPQNDDKKTQNDHEVASDKEKKEDSKTDKEKKAHHSHRTRSKETKELSSWEQKINPIEVKKPPNVENEIVVLKNNTSKNKNDGGVKEKEKKRSTSNDKRKSRKSDKESANKVADAPREIKLKSILRNSSNDTKSINSGTQVSSDGPGMRYSTRIKNSETTKSESISSQLEDSLKESKKPRISNTKALKTSESRNAKKSITKQESMDLVVGDQSTIFDSTISKNVGKSPQRTRKRVAEDQVSTASTPKRSRSGNLEMSPSIARTGTPSRLSLRQKQSILFTAFSNEKMMTEIRKLGAGVVTDALSCTVVVTERVKRTFKLLCAVGLGKPIVGQTWMQACIDAGTLVDPWLYILQDEEVENRYKFKLSTTLSGERNFLVGYSISATPSVLPAATEMKQIVECSGGRWGESRSSTGRWFCVTCLADRLLWPALRRRGAVLVTSELVLGGVLTQQLNPKGCKIPDE